MIVLAIAAAAYIANLIVGPKLYPEFRLPIGMAILTLTFFAWLIDAIITSVRLRVRGK